MSWCSSANCCRMDSLPRLPAWSALPCAEAVRESWEATASPPFRGCFSGRSGRWLCGSSRARYRTSTSRPTADHAARYRMDIAVHTKGCTEL